MLTTMNMEPLPRNFNLNATPARIKRQGLNPWRRHNSSVVANNKTKVDLHFSTLHGLGARNTVGNMATGEGSDELNAGPNGASSRAGDDTTLGDLSKYAYSDCGGADESLKLGRNPAVNSSTEPTGFLAPAPTPDLNDSKSAMSYLDDSNKSFTADTVNVSMAESINLLQMQQMMLAGRNSGPGGGGGGGGGGSLMEASVTPSKQSQTPSGSEDLDLNQMSLTSFSQDDIMSALNAEDSINLNLHRENMHDSFQEDLRNQHLIEQIITESSKARKNNEQGTTTDARPQNSTANSSQHTEKDTGTNHHSQSSYSQTDLEKSILVGQARALAAEIDSPMHLQRNNRRRPDPDGIPITVQEIRIPDHKRLRHKRDSNSQSLRDLHAEGRLQTKHSTISPFVLKRSQSERQTQATTMPTVDTDGHLKTIHSRESHSTTNSRIKTIHSRESEDGSANSLRAQRKARKPKNQLAVPANTTPSVDAKSHYSNTSKLSNRGSVHATPTPPNQRHRQTSSNGDDDDHDHDDDQSRSRSTRTPKFLRKAKSTGSVMGHKPTFQDYGSNQERNPDFLNDPIHHAMKTCYENYNGLEDDNKTLRSRMTRMLSRTFGGRRHSTETRKQEKPVPSLPQVPPQPKEGSNVEVDNDGADQDYDDENSIIASLGVTKRPNRLGLLSIARSIKMSFRRNKSKPEEVTKNINIRYSDQDERASSAMGETEIQVHVDRQHPYHQNNLDPIQPQSETADDHTSRNQKKLNFSQADLDLEELLSLQTEEKKLEPVRPNLASFKPAASQDTLVSSNSKRRNMFLGSSRKGSARLIDIDSLWEDTPVKRKHASYNRRGTETTGRPKAPGTHHNRNVMSTLSKMGLGDSYTSDDFNVSSSQSLPSSHTSRQTLLTKSNKPSIQSTVSEENSKHLESSSDDSARSLNSGDDSSVNRRGSF